MSGICDEKLGYKTDLTENVIFTLEKLCTRLKMQSIANPKIPDTVKLQVVFCSNIFKAISLTSKTFTFLLQIKEFLKTFV